MLITLKLILVHGVTHLKLAERKKFHVVYF